MKCPALVEQANKLAGILNIDNLSCTRSWIQRWREKHVLVHDKIQGEAGAVNLEICDDWVENV